MIFLWIMVVLLSVFKCYDVIDKTIFVPDEAIYKKQVGCPDKMAPPTIPKDFTSLNLNVFWTDSANAGLNITDH